MPTKQNENTESNAQTQYMCMYVCISQRQEEKRASYSDMYGEILQKFIPQRALL